MRRLPPLLLLGLLGCWYPASRGKELQTQVNELASDNVRLQGEVKQQREQLTALAPRIEEKIAEVTRALQSLETGSRRSSADIGVQLQKTVEDVARLRGQVEEYVFKIGEVESGLARVKEEVAQRPAAPPAPPPEPEVKRPQDKKEFLALAQSKAAAGEHPLARQLFTEFLKKWGRDPLAGEAYFGLGESYFAEGHFREALPEFKKVMLDHPKTPSAPTAYLRSAECFRQLKMVPESRETLELLVADYPKSDAAKTARARLAEMDKAGKKAPAPKRGTR
jgi:tol-pal system protein YbgF